MIARESAYHGSLEVSASLTGMSYCHDGFGLPGNMVIRTAPPYYGRFAEPGESEVAYSRRLARELDQQIQAEDPATIGGFIGEPAIGSGGLIPPPQGYWAEIRNVLAKYDILLVADNGLPVKLSGLSLI
jgi:adenosylmethionine-8-amino-7-oxononanoate aminotransferase